MIDPLLEAQLRRHEGVRDKPYRDTVGKTTIGVGRNLDDVGVSEDEILLMLRNDIAGAQRGLDATLPWWTGLGPARARVLLDMTFNLGIERLLGFSATLSAMREGRYEDAARDMLASRWAQQVGRRATELAQTMRTGRDDAGAAS